MLKIPNGDKNSIEKEEERDKRRLWRIMGSVTSYTQSREKKTHLSTNYAGMRIVPRMGEETILFEETVSKF